MGPRVLKGNGAVGVGPDEGHKVDQRAGVPLFEETLRKLGSISLEKRELRGNLIVSLQYLNQAYKHEGDKIFSWSDSESIRGDSFKLKERKFMLDIRQKFFSQRMVRH